MRTYLPTQANDKFSLVISPMKMPGGQGVVGTPGLTLCNSKVQQPHRTKPTASDRRKPVDPRQRPSSTLAPLVHTEEIKGTERVRLLRVS